MDKPLLFIDSDVIIDLLARRGHFAAASQLFGLIEQEAVRGATTPIVLANVAYIIEKYSNRITARKAVRRILDLITVLSVDEVTARKAVDSRFLDFEDAMQYYAPEKNGIEIILTRNKKDHSKGSITTMTAEEFLAVRTADPRRGPR